MPTGGLETHLFGFVREMRRLGHRVSMVTGIDARQEELTKQVGDRILTLPFSHTGSGAQVLEWAERIATFCREQQGDVLHLQPFVTLHVGALAAALAKLPFVLTPARSSKPRLSGRPHRELPPRGDGAGRREPGVLRVGHHGRARAEPAAPCPMRLVAQCGRPDQIPSGDARSAGGVGRACPAGG